MRCNYGPQARKPQVFWIWTNICCFRNSILALLQTIAATYLGDLDVKVIKGINKNSWSCPFNITEKMIHNWYVEINALPFFYHFI